MRLLQNLATCNQNVQILSWFKNIDSTNISPANLEISLKDIIGNEVDTTISLDNILIAGQNVKWTQELALLMKKELATRGILTRIIDISSFVALADTQKRNAYLKYIVLCDDIYTSIKHIHFAKYFVGTQILFKIDGIHWKRGDYGVEVSEEAKSVLKFLGLLKYDEFTVEFLASLGPKEFCVINKNNISKRSL